LDYISLEDENKLNEIDWKKSGFIKKDMIKRKDNQKVKVGDIVYHQNFGYLKV